MSLRDSNVPRVVAPHTLEIHLTDVETSVCQLLDDCTKSLQEEKGISTTCRIAGGWVRDKLLGSQSKDIDVALSDIMGLAFAEHLTSFAQTKGVEMGSITKIEQNPDQSKHLETATFKVFGLDIDLVNLRSEEYADGSRIPAQVTFGTPLEDALRRDITINALFYNVHTRNVEDFTEKGLDDLRNGIIRTPLAPRETFQDDPLRILRCIRFASRYGFEMVPELVEAARDPAVQDALASKVSRERLGDEIGKMMTGRDPLRSAQLIHELSLYDTIFYNISKEAKSTVSGHSTRGPDEALAAISIFHALVSLQDPQLLSPDSGLLSVIQTDSISKARLYLAAILIPYLGLTYQNSKKKTLPVVELVIRDSLKLGTQNHYLDGIPILFSAVPLITKHVTDNSQEPLDRLRLGLLLRNKIVHNANTGNHWSTTVLFSLVTELVPFYSVAQDVFDIHAASSLVASYNLFIERIHELNLSDDVEARPLLNGQDVVAALGVSQSGAWVGKALEDVVEWQLSHPGQSKEDCLQWFKNYGPDKYSSLISKRPSGPASKRLRTK
ncbi:hypothetical protein B0H34DRAFT_683268 [Crassisporium funariophilum]|nr:hypothetical protein B0H34DRAFT_683268 [Crassisporium funariophilum]